MGIFRRRLNDYEVEQRKNKEKKTLTKHSSLFARRSEANDGSPPNSLLGQVLMVIMSKLQKNQKNQKNQKDIFWRRIAILSILVWSVCNEWALIHRKQDLLIQVKNMTRK